MWLNSSEDAGKSDCETDFIQVCNNVTSRFQTLSSQMISIEEELKLSQDNLMLANVIRKIQDEEREHLRLVIALQVERKRLDLLRLTADKATKSHNEHGEQHRCTCSAKTEEQIEDLQDLICIQEDKVKWMKQQTLNSESKINELLDEVRYWEVDKEMI
ncbi:hypothetical protein GUITHDRAFT_99746 [Guillardia theta CCMP2712]|uniref:Uncharacterized protein n=2 Tax=Guillardia theta TaxID=55529 RepID=L1K157_GUITC|nr:hypothetical protein GUITHDRAFT_99746 [Guillardia theta CCMP2712]EKX54269.1 hypothetical protein GUITHDRAFT_99746 [Guillardia theta CCMP2712]|eukprot:XP_005841249.1 hypothetical protein GUITHDRAFT_99746 [Guillardia theta CCMP2712]